VLGDATTAFTYPLLNTAFRLLIEKPGTPLITMGVGYLLMFTLNAQIEIALLFSTK